MYKKILEYFEKTYCIDNIFFRKYWLEWFLGWISIIISNVLINKLIENLGYEQLFVKTVIIMIITVVPFIIIICNCYKRIYIEIIGNDKKRRIDFLSFLMDESIYPLFFDTKLRGMKEYLHKEFNIDKREQIEELINIAQKELNNRYSKKSLTGGFLNNIYPFLILILTTYFTNNNIKDLESIIIYVIVLIIIAFSFYAICNFYINIKLTPVNKRENLLQFIEVLENLKLE